MNPRLRSALWHVVLIVGTVVVGFVLLRDRARIAEADATAAVLRALGGNVLSLRDHSILVAPAEGPLFRVVVTPSCSSVASVLALLALSTVTPPASRARRLASLTVAVGAVVLGNFVRIAASLVAGLVAGRGSLVLFHDAVGTMFTFASTLGGYMLMLWLLLPDRRADRRTDHRPTAATAGV